MLLLRAGSQWWTTSFWEESKHKTTATGKRSSSMGRKISPPFGEDLCWRPQKTVDVWRWLHDRVVVVDVADVSISNPNSNSVGMPAREVTPGSSDSHDENDIFFSLEWSGGNQWVNSRQLTHLSGARGWWWHLGFGAAGFWWHVVPGEITHSHRRRESNSSCSESRERSHFRQFSTPVEISLRKVISAG